MLAPIMFPDVHSHHGDEVRASPGNNPRTYPVVVPCCYKAWVIIYVIVTLAFNVGIAFLTVHDARVVELFSEDRSWCIISPRQVGDDNNPCIDVDNFWDSDDVTPADMFHGGRCEWTDGDQYSVNFCNDASTTTFAWCQNIYDLVVTPHSGQSTSCGSLELTYLDASNFSLYEDEYLTDAGYGDYEMAWTWAYPAILDFWLFFVIAGALAHPRSIRRNGSQFEIQTACSTARVPLADVHMVLAFDRFNWCVHRYVLRGLRYFTFSLWCGSYANNQPLVVLVTQACSTSSYRLGMAQADYEQFMADNVTALGTPALGTDYGTIAVRSEVPATVATTEGHVLPVASVAGGGGSETRKY